MVPCGQKVEAIIIYSNYRGRYLGITWNNIALNLNSRAFSSLIITFVNYSALFNSRIQPKSTIFSLLKFRRKFLTQQNICHRFFNNLSQQPVCKFRNFSLIKCNAIKLYKNNISLYHVDVKGSCQRTPNVYGKVKMSFPYIMQHYYNCHMRQGSVRK